MTKDNLINKLTLIDTSNYRIMGLYRNNKFAKEKWSRESKYAEAFNPRGH